MTRISNNPIASSSQTEAPASRKEQQNPIDKTQIVAQTKFKMGIAESVEKALKLKGKDLNSFIEKFDGSEFNLVDEWILDFLSSIPDCNTMPDQKKEDVLAKIQKKIDELDLLSSPSRLAVLTVAKELADERLELLKKPDPNSAAIFASIAQMFDEKIQKLKDAEPTLTFKLPIDTNKEKLKDKLDEEAAIERKKRLDAKEREEMRRWVRTGLMVTAGVATAYGVDYLATSIFRNNVVSYLVGVTVFTILFNEIKNQIRSQIIVIKA